MYVRIPEAKYDTAKTGDSRLFPILGAYRKMPEGSRMVTLPMMSRDPMTSS